MKFFLSLILLAFSLSYVRAQVVINEVYLNEGFVEIKNQGDTIVNVSQYYLVSEDAEVRLGTRLPYCGGGLEHDLDPGEISMIDMHTDFASADGELIFFTNNDFADTTAAIDYVQWGNSGHAYESFAVAAELWTAGDFVESVLDGGSLEYDGNGDTSSDWEPAAAPSGCEENGTGCEVGIGTITSTGEGYHACIGDGDIDGYSFTFFGNTAAHLKAVVLNNENRILGFSTTGWQVDLEHVLPEDTAGTYAIMLGHNGPIGNLEIGNNIEDLVGCFAYSVPFYFKTRIVHQGDLEATYHDTVFNSQINLCASDGIPDVIIFENTSPDSLEGFVIVNAETNRVVDIITGGFIRDFEGDALTELYVRSFSYDGVILGEIGDNALFVRGSPCDVLTTNTIFINTNVCINATSAESGNEHLILSPNPVSGYLTISNLHHGTVQIIIYNLMGNNIDNKLIPTEGNQISLPTDQLASGVYLLNIIQHGHLSSRMFMKI